MIGYIGNNMSLDYYAAASFYVKEELYGYKTIGRLFHALKEKEVEGIIVPYFNAKDGVFNNGLYRIEKNHFHIERYIELDVLLQLVGLTSVLTDIKEIILTREDYEDAYLNIQAMKHVIKKTFVHSREEALNLVKDSNQAALTVSQLPHKYNILRSNLRDEPHNEFAYFLVGPKLKTNGLNNRLVLNITFNQTNAFSLNDILHETMMFGYTCEHIVTKPKLEEEDGVIITINANLEDEKLKDLFRLLQLKTNHISIVGNYYKKVSAIVENP